MPEREDKVRRVPFAERTEERREARAEAEAVNWLLARSAGELPPQSATAGAVHRGATWREILELARWEEAAEIEALLEEALRELGPDLHEPRSR